MSPNQRKPGKEKVGVWLTQDEKEQLERAALAYGTDLSTLIKMAIDDAAKRKGIKQKPGNKK